MRISYSSILVFLFLNLIFLPPFKTKAQDSNKVCIAVRTARPPKIDGIMNEEEWKHAAPATDFEMNRPVEGGKPTFRTEVRVLYDDRAVYVGAMMYDGHPDSILQELGNRDDGDLNGDFFRFVIDPYNLRQDAFDFGVWASGVQIDSKFSDPTFNAVWTSDVKISDKGWCVEMEIPFSAIRFPKKPVQEWGFQTTRTIRRTREFDQWALTPSVAANAQVYWGTLKGIENIQTPVRLSLTPYVSTYVERSPDYNADNTYHYSNSLTYNFGADIKYGIDDRFTLDMTLLPDFGQVQSDNKVKNLSYREVTYSEYRSFFKEGTEMFSRNGLFYTRRIGKSPTLYYSVADSLKSGESLEDNPSTTKLLNAFKISGRNNHGLGIGFFNAITDNTYATIRDSVGNERKIMTEPLTNYNVFVLDQQLNNFSSVWFMNTNTQRAKNFNGSDVSLAGFTLADKKNRFATDGIFALSQTFVKSSPGVNALDSLGHRYFFGVRKIGGQLQYGISHSLTSQTYNQLDLGYYIVPNIENTHGYVLFQWFQPWIHLREGNISLSGDYTTNPITGKRTSFLYSVDAFANMMSYNAFYFGAGASPLSNLDYNEPRVSGRYYQTIPFWFAYAGISSDYRKAFSVDLNFNFGNDLSRFISEGYNYSLQLRYRFSDRFTMRLTNRYSYDPFNFGVADYSDTSHIIFGARRLQGYENILSGVYVFKVNMEVTLNARHYWSTANYRQYCLLQSDGSTPAVSDYTGDANFSYNVFNIDLVYSWQFAPGSNLSLVYKNAIETSSDLMAMSFSDDFRHTIQSPQLNSFSIKVIYYLDYLYLKKR